MNRLLQKNVVYPERIGSSERFERLLTARNRHFHSAPINRRLCTLNHINHHTYFTYHITSHTIYLISDTHFTLVNLSGFRSIVDGCLTRNSIAFSLSPKTLATAELRHFTLSAEDQVQTT